MKTYIPTYPHTHPQCLECEKRTDEIERKIDLQTKALEHVYKMFKSLLKLEELRLELVVKNQKYE